MQAPKKYTAWVSPLWRVRRATKSIYSFGPKTSCCPPSRSHAIDRPLDLDDVDSDGVYSRRMTSILLRCLPYTYASECWVAVMLLLRIVYLLTRSGLTELVSTIDGGRLAK